MRLKLTLRRGDQPVDLVVTADATATVGDVAQLLRDADPQRGDQTGAPVTLRVTDPFAAASARTLDAATTMADSALLSGSTVALHAVDARFLAPGSDRGTPVAVVRVLAGPDAGLEFPLPPGASVIGRERDCEIRLSDPMVSKHHARINTADAIEIIDLGSANGVIVSGDTVGRAALTTSDVVVLGDTSLCVLRLQQQTVTASTPQVEHVRSPRVVPAYPGTEFPAPTPPKLPGPRRFPYLALLAPLAMGAAMWALTHQLIGVIMMAMSPLLLVAGYVDQSVTARRELKASRKEFDKSMLRMQEVLEAARDEERRVRLEELPSSARLQEDVRRLGALVWVERPEHARFLSLHTGTGTVPSRNKLVLPGTRDTVPECWDQLTALHDEYSRIDRVPVEVQLRESGSFGVAGGTARATDVARGLVFQLCARHSPAELVVTALISPRARLDWDWLKWLPHTSSAHSPLEAGHLADSRGAASALLSRIEGLVDSRATEPASPRGAVDPDKHDRDVPAPVVPAVLLVVENDAPVDRARLTRVVERGADVGVHVIWCSPTVDQVPAACRSFVSIDPHGPDGIVGQVRLGSRTAPVAVELMDAASCEQLARILSPVIDAGAPEADDSDLPRAVSYPLLAGVDLLDSAPSVIDRWRQNNSLTPRDGSAPVPRRKEGTLRALIGHTGAEPLSLDLRADGPHALVGGTTGAGKSEFLQAWVLGMASAHSPDRLTFLFVDYKGGSAFADCVQLPHTVGLVTDLSPHLVRRALTSLRAELRYREHLLNEKKAKDLVTLEKRGDPDCPPSLVIIVDEFAALVNEVPEFVDGVVDVAQRGRSLGLHLVLATQRPAGVIKDNLRANTNLRIALRMADTEDSADILGDARAAHFDPSIPGRGAAKTGPGRIRAFQTGYAGGRTTGEPPAPRIDVNELDFGGNAAWEAPVVEVAEKGESGPTDIARIVSTVRSAASQAGVPEPRKPWLAELAPIYSFGRLPNPRTDERLPLGVVDRPDIQAQPTVFFEPDRDGNLAVFGTGGSGKSTVLRTIAVAAAATTRNGGPTHVYGLDFGSRGLTMLEGLPHVGAVISGDDEERVVRTIRMLRDIVDDRAVRYAAARADSIGEYRRAANAPDEPRILLLVDGIGAFREQYEFGAANLSSWFTAFAQIAADGRAVGVHVIMTADRPNALPPTISSTVQRRIVLRLTSEDDYMMLGVAKDILTTSSPPGRGIIDGDEVQIAILGESGNVAVQSRELQRLAGSLGRAGGSRPAAVLRLPEQIALADLPAAPAGSATIGIDDTDLREVAIATRGTFVLAGSQGGGRTTALGAIAAAVRRSAPGTRTVLLTPRRSVWAGAGWTSVATSAAEVAALVPTLTAEIESGAASHTAIFIEALPEFTGTEAEYELDRLVRTAAREDHFVLGEGETSAWSQAYTLAAPFKAGRRGLLLVPGDMDGDTLLSTSLGRLRRRDFPPGRGFLVESGRAVKLQVALPGDSS